MPREKTRKTASKPDRYGDRLHLRQHALSPSLLKVANYIDTHRAEALDLSALDIAARTGTSDATVIRATQALGFTGLMDLKTALHSGLDGGTPSEKLAATMELLGPPVESSIDFVLGEYQHAMAALTDAENRAAIASAVSLLARANRIAIFGLGAAGVLATYTARLFNRNGSQAYALNTTGGQLAEQLQHMHAGDCLLIMLQGRQHREAAATLAEARRLNMPVAMVVGTRDSALYRDADCAIVIPRAKQGQAAVHGPTLLCLEILVMGVAALDPDRSVTAIERFVNLRSSILSSKRLASGDGRFRRSSKQSKPNGT